MAYDDTSLRSFHDFPKYNNGNNRIEQNRMRIIVYQASLSSQQNIMRIIGIVEQSKRLTEQPSTELRLGNKCICVPKQQMMGAMVYVGAQQPFLNLYNVCYHFFAPTLLVEWCPIITNCTQQMMTSIARMPQPYNLDNPHKLDHEAL